MQLLFFFFSSRRRHTRFDCDWSSDVCSSDLYLAPLQGDWREELATNLLNALGSNGSIFMYSSFERTHLRGLAELFPELSSRFDGVIARLFDLHDVVKDGYAHPGFGGRTSIKKVLPV